MLTTTTGIYLMGLQLGATACTISCLPVMTPLLLSDADDKRQATAMLMKFFGAKVAAYTLIALLSYYGADFIKSRVPESTLFTQAAAVFIISLGVLLFYRALMPQTGCGSSACRASRGFGYVGAGFFSSFSFCIPVTSLMAFSAISGSMSISMLYGALFGMGAVTLPFLIFYFFVYRITSSAMTSLMHYKRQMKATSALLLMIIGGLVYAGIVKL